MAKALATHTAVPAPSDDEHERRLRLVREGMAEESLEVLVCVGDERHRGDVRYLTEHSIWSQRAYAILGVEGLPTLVVSMSSQQYWARQRVNWVRDVRSHRPPIAEVVATLESSLPRLQRIGVSGLDEHMPIGDLNAIQNAFPETEIVDATPLMQRIRTAKSSEEIRLVRHTAAIAVDAYERATEIAAPGVTETELFAEIDAVGRRQGVVSTIMLTSNGPYLREPRQRVMEDGDLQMVSVEIAGPTGYWVEFGGTIPIGSVSDRNRRLLDACEAAFTAGADVIHEGARCSDAATAVSRVLRESGYAAGIWGGHGIGLDTVEGPRLTDADSTVIREDMVFGFHPHLIDEETGVGAYVANTVLASRSSGILLASRSDHS